MNNNNVENHDEKSKNHQDTNQCPNLKTCIRNLSGPENISSTLDNKQLFNISDTFNAFNSSYFSQINDINSVVSRNKSSSNGSTSSILDNRYLNNSATFFALNSFYYPRINEINAFVSSNELSSQPSKSSTLDNNGLLNNSVKFYALNSSYFPQIWEKNADMFSYDIYPQKNISSTLSNNHSSNSSKKFNSHKSSDFPKTNKKNANNIYPQQNNSSTLDKNRSSNRNTTHHSCNLSDSPKINKKNVVEAVNNKPPQQNISSTLNKDCSSNRNEKFYIYNLSDFPKINEKNTVKSRNKTYPQQNTSSTLDNNCLSNSNATIRSYDLSDFPKIDEKNSVKSRNEMYTQPINISSTWGNNRLRNCNATFDSYNLSDFPKINEKNAVKASNNIYAQQNIYATWDNNRSSNSNATIHSYDLSDFPKINDTKCKSSTGFPTVKGKECIQRTIKNCKTRNSKSLDTEYVNAIKKNLKSAFTDFIISDIDFPKLSYSRPNNDHSDNTIASKRVSSQIESSTYETNEPPDDGINNEIPCNSNLNTDTQNYNSKSRIESTLDGKVTNIPDSMLHDQFGIVAILLNLRNLSTYPSLSSIYYGPNLLTLLREDTEHSGNLYSKFPGPFQDAFLGPNHIDYDVPPKYKLQDKINLPPINLSKYTDVTLFYLFYTHYSDRMQLQVADELYARDWRYHTELLVWITNTPEMNVLEKSTEWEEGTYYVFDTDEWLKVLKQLKIDCSKLEKRS